MEKIEYHYTLKVRGSGVYIKVDYIGEIPYSVEKEPQCVGLKTARKHRLYIQMARPEMIIDIIKVRTTTYVDDNQPPDQEWIQTSLSKLTRILFPSRDNYFSWQRSKFGVDFLDMPIVEELLMKHGPVRYLVIYDSDKTLDWPYLSQIIPMKRKKNVALLATKEDVAVLLLGQKPNVIYDFEDATILT